MTSSLKGARLREVLDAMITGAGAVGPGYPQSDALRLTGQEVKALATARLIARAEMKRRVSPTPRAHELRANLPVVVRGGG